MTTPENTVQAQGVGSVGADVMNTWVQWCTTAAVLRNFVGNSNMVVALQGTSNVNDGNAGLFYWDATGTQPDDNLNYIVPPAAPAGEWVRLTTASGSLVLAGDVTGPLNANVIADGVIVSSMFSAGAVDTTALGTGAVTSVKIANSGVATANVAANAITNPKLAQAPAMTLKGNNTGGTANEQDLTVAEVNAMLTGGSPSVLSATAFVYFTWTGATVSIYASSGVSGVVRSGAGDYAVTLSPGLTFAAGFAVVSVGRSTSANVVGIPASVGPFTAGNTYNFQSRTLADSAVDANDFLIIFY